MLSKDFLAIDLNPETWKNLGDIIDIIHPYKCILYVLHDKGNILNVLHSDRGLLNGENIDFNDLEGSVARLFYKFHEVEEIQIFDKNSLIEYYNAIQASSFPELDSDEYLSYTINLLFHTEGIGIYNRNKRQINFLGRIRELVYKNIPENCTVALAIFYEGKLFFDAIFRFEEYKLKLITSFDHFEADGFNSSISIDDRDAVADIIKNKLGGPVQIIFMEKTEFTVFAEIFIQ